MNRREFLQALTALGVGACMTPLVDLAELAPVFVEKPCTPAVVNAWIHSTIGTDGVYSSVAEWEMAGDTNLVEAGITWVGEVGEVVEMVGARVSRGKQE